MLAIQGEMAKPIFYNNIISEFTVQKDALNEVNY